MWYGLFSRDVKPAKKSRRARPQHFGHRLLLEPLEDRSLLSLGLLSVPIAELAAAAASTISTPIVVQPVVHPPVARAATTTSLSLSAPTSTYSVPITAKVAISSTTAGTPTGSVAISVNGHVVDVVSVATAAAGVSLTPPAGADKITATYRGDRTFGSSTSSRQTETVAQAQTTISLASSTTYPTIYGSQIVFAATVSPVSPALGPVSGQVEFFDNAGTTPFATQRISGTQGIATLTWRDLAVGANSITAEFLANNNYAGSGLSTAIKRTVDAAASKTELISSQNPLPSNTAVTFTAYVLPNVTASPLLPGGVGGNVGQPPLATPSGSITFTATGKKNTTPITDTVTLTNGKATWTPSPNLADDTYTVTAAYVPDGGSDYTASDTTASPLSEVVGGLASKTTLVASANPVKSGTQATFTVVVGSGSTTSSTVPTGIVTLVNKSDPKFTPLTQTLSGGTASFKLTLTSPPRTDSFIATYSGDTVYCGSQTQLVEWVTPVRPTPPPVTPEATATALFSSQNPLPSNTAVTFSAIVTPSVTNTTSPTPLGKPIAPPTGAVVFTAKMANGTVVASAPIKLVFGEADWTPSPNLADGTYTVTAAYTPDSSNYLASDSTASPLTEVVGGLASHTTLTPSANPVQGGTLVTFTVTVAAGPGSPAVFGSLLGKPVTTSVASPTAVPTGTVTVVDQSDPSLFNKTFTLDGTTDTFTFTVTMPSTPPVAKNLIGPIAPPPDLFVATYSGDTTYCGSSFQIVEWVSPIQPTPILPLPIVGGGGPKV